MKLQNRKAFTMLELIFVIVIIGILSAVAIPKFAMNREDAVVAKAKNTVASVRSAIAVERQKRILRGNFNKIEKLSNTPGANKAIFDGFDGDTNNPVLEYPLQSCAGTSDSYECWIEGTTGDGTAASPREYTYYMPTGTSVIFELKDNRFDCKTLSTPNCNKLTR